jgi:hypothetical protein
MRPARHHEAPTGDNVKPDKLLFSALGGLTRPRGTADMQRREKSEFKDN